MISSRVSAFAGVGLYLALLGSPARAQSLDAALAEAYGSNPTLNAQRAAARAFDENVPQALAGYRPTLAATADVSADTSSSRIAALQGRQSTSLFPRGVGLQLNQTLFNGFRTGNSVRSAEANVLNQRETLRNVEQTVLLDAVTAYMNVLRDAALLNLEQNNVEVLEEQLKQTQDRFDVGEVTRTDVEQAKASLAGARSSMLGAQAQLKTSTAIYRQVIGSEPRRLGPARDLGKRLPRSLPAAVDLGLRTHPSITAALHAVDAAALQVKVAEGALLPSVTATGSVSQRFDVTGSTRDTADATIGAFLTVPIYEGGVDYSRTRQAKETLGQTRIQADVTREQVRAAVVSAWGTLEATTAQITATQAQVDAAEVALSGVREEAKVGQRTTLDVLNQQQTLLNARVSLITAQRDRVVAAYSLLSSVGRLDARTLGLKVATYDPAVHYDQVRNKWIGTNTPDGR
jgi:outer membrane protein